MPYTLLICNGELVDPPHARQLADGAERILCADGGANAAVGIGILPHVVIGDFDSVDGGTRALCERAGVRFIHEPSQDRTDFEKALAHIGGTGSERVLILGMTGKSIDHTLGNFSTLMRYCRAMDITAFDTLYRIDVMNRSRSFWCMPGDRISILPLVVANGLTYNGLKYPLRNAALTFGSSEGTSNAALSYTFSIDMQSGAVLVFRQMHEELWEEGR